MEVVVSADAKSFARLHGGVVYVRSHAHRCCSGPLTLLDTTAEVPPDAGEFVTLSDSGDDITVRYRGDAELGPHVLTVELRGRWRRRLVSYWDGCAYDLHGR